MTGSTLTTGSIPGYIARHPELAAQVDGTDLVVDEVGDGNLNQVFLCRGADGRTLVLKQALPYVRLVGPSWPMTEERATREAEAIRAHAALSGNVCRVTFFDPEQHVLALEDLTDHTVLRTHLNQGEDITGVPEILGRHVADTGFGTGPYGVGEEPFRLAAAAAVNSELCTLTEAVIFTEPFLGAERNSVSHPDTAERVAALQADPVWVAGAMRAKRRFVTVQEALLHGDLHTGSVFVRRDPDGWSVRTFDPEFSFYGPIGFDTGLLQANLMIAAVRADVLGEHDRRDALVAGVQGVWDAFEARFLELAAQRDDPARWTDASIVEHLAEIRLDSTDFAACEAARRIIGLAKVTDIQTLPAEQYRAAAAAVLGLTRHLLAERTLPAPELYRVG